MASSLCYYRVLLMHGWGLWFDLPPSHPIFPLGIQALVAACSSWLPFCCRRAVSTGMVHQSSWHHNNVNNNCLSFPGKELRAFKEACLEHVAESESGANSDNLAAGSLVNLLLSPCFVVSVYVLWVAEGFTMQYPCFGWVCWAFVF